MNHVITLWKFVQEIVIKNVEEFLKLNPLPATDLNNLPKN